MRGRVVRACLVAVGLVLTGCAGGPAKAPESATLLPGPQQAPTHQVVGEAIIASLSGVSTTVRWLPQKGVEAFYEGRQGLANPWPRQLWKDTPPTIFFLRLRNQTREEVQFDPGLASLVTQEGKRNRPIPYEDLYMRIEDEKDASPKLVSLQATLFSRFIVIQPGGQREGLLVFPTLDPTAKHLLLELSSFYVGGRLIPGVFEFQVVRPPSTP